MIAAISSQTAFIFAADAIGCSAEADIFAFRYFIAAITLADTAFAAFLMLPGCRLCHALPPFITLMPDCRLMPR